MAGEGNGEVLWRRTTSSGGRRWMVWAAGGVILLSGFGSFAAWMAEDLESIRFFAGVGALLLVLIAVGPPLLRLVRKVDAELVLDGSVLRCGKQQPIDVSDLTSWEVVSGVQDVHGGSGASSRLPWLRLRLQHADGRSSELVWSHPHSTDEEALREAMVERFGIQNRGPGHDFTPNPKSSA